MLKLNNFFQDKAVFQRGKSIPVWGRADADSKIKVEFAGSTFYGKSNIDGAFKIRLQAVGAGGPYTLKVTVCSSGETVVCNDILVGDVWLASGQSNMEYQLGADWVHPEATNPEGMNREQEKEFKDTVKNSEKFRFIVVEKNASALEEDSFAGEWKYMTSENAPECSAVGAWFGKYISEELDIPVGIVVCAWGGTIAESWTSRAGLLANPETAFMTDRVEEIYGNEETWDITADEILKRMIPCEFADSGNEGVKWGWAETDFDDSSWQTMIVPGSWIVQQIAGNGAVWFRKTVNLSAEWLGRDLVLELGGVDKQDITYFNGVEIGRTGKDCETVWFDKRRFYKIPANLVKEGKNVIAVRAYSFLYDGSLNGQAEYFNLVVDGTDEKINLAGEWLACAEKDMGKLSGNDMQLGPMNANTPSILFNGMIKPLLPYALKGVIWYQGESNARDVSDSAAYLKKLEIMIRDWYYHFEQGEFPFIQVQLAYMNRGTETLCNNNSAWAVLRESQRLLCEKMDNVYMATAIDIGDRKDIHPQDKKTVGFRLAQCALHNVYFKNEVVPFGPLYKYYLAEGNKIRLVFDNSEGMYIKEDLPQSFYIAGSNRHYYPADEVVIENGTVAVSSKEVKHPCFVRYAWADEPVSTLYNSAGLPASSFQTEKENR